MTALGVSVLGGATVAPQIARIMKYAFEVADEELEKAADLGALMARAMAPEDTGAYKYGGRSRSGTTVSSGIHHEKVGDHSWAWGTPAAYGRVLELGYFGVDRAGRSRNNPPRPHFGPSMEPVGDFFIQNMLARGFVR